MKRIVALLLAGALCLSILGTASARECCSETYLDESDGHPLRIAAYLVHPVGFAAKWLVTLPLHCLVSLPYASEFFGYDPRDRTDARGLPEV